MQVKISLAIVLAALVGAAMAAPTKATESCEELFEGDMSYLMNRIDGKGGSEHGILECKGGRMELNEDAKEGTKVVFERCWTQAPTEHARRVQMIGRLKKKDGKCLTVGRNTNELTAGKCNKDAEIVQGSMDGYRFMTLDLRGSKAWSTEEKEGKKVVVVQESKEEEWPSMSLRGKFIGLDGGGAQCKAVAENIKLELEGKRVAERKGKLVVGTGSGVKVTVEVCAADGFAEGDAQSIGTRVVAGGKCLAVGRKSKHEARFEECASEGEKLEEQWMRYDGQQVVPMDKEGKFKGVQAWKAGKDGEVMGSEEGKPLEVQMLK